MSKQKLKIYRCGFINNRNTFNKNVIMYDCVNHMELIYSFEYRGIPLISNSIRRDYNLVNYVTAYLAYELDPEPVELEFSRVCQIYDSLNNEKCIFEFNSVYRERFRSSIELLELIMINYI